MSQRVTIVLALLLALAIGWAWMDARRGDVGDQAAPADRVKRILAIELGSIDEIHIEREGHSAHFQKRDGVWSGSSDPARVTTLLDTLRDLAEILAIEHGAARLAELGLSPPRGSVRLSSTGKSVVELRMGNRNPAATGMYLQVGEGGPVVLTGALLEWELDKIFPRVAAES